MNKTDCFGATFPQGRGDFVKNSSWHLEILIFSFKFVGLININFCE